LKKHLQRNGRNFTEISGTIVKPFEKNDIFSENTIIKFVLDVGITV